jgi:hypothetical protein
VCKIPDEDEKTLKIYPSYPGKKRQCGWQRNRSILKKMYVWKLEFCQSYIIGYAGYYFFHACGLINCITFNLMTRYKPQYWINPGTNPSWITQLMSCGHLLELSLKLILSGAQMLRIGPITVHSASKELKWFFCLCL